METDNIKKVLVSGASIAGLSTAYWLNKLGYKVTVIELANEPRVNGAAVDLKGDTIDIIKRMGIFEQLKSKRLQVEKIEFKNAEDGTEGTMIVKNDNEENEVDEIEIERDVLLGVLFDTIKNDVEFIFNNSITALKETENGILATFKSGSQQEYDLIIGCDGMHSGVRKIWFGEENQYAHFLKAYSSITTVSKLLVPQNTLQMYNTPGKAIMLNAYKNKTDIIFCFLSDTEIPYDYRNIDQQRKIILKEFKGEKWRTAELLNEIKQSDKFYFDKFCQIKMPSWTKGRVALVGDAAHCASPAAGMGGSLAVKGATALADSLQKHNGNFELAFADYNNNLRPFIEEVQAEAELNIKENFIPRTEEAIRERNVKGF